MCLKNKTQICTYFQPGDVQEKFFIETAAIYAAATVILSAFLKGVMSRLEVRAEGLGEKSVEWMVDRLEELFRSGADETAEAELEETVDKVRTAVANSDSANVSAAVEDAEVQLKEKLDEHNMLRERSDQIVGVVRHSAMTLVDGG